MMRDNDGWPFGKNSGKAQVMKMPFAIVIVGHLIYTLADFIPILSRLLAYLGAQPEFTIGNNRYGVRSMEYIFRFVYY